MFSFALGPTLLAILHKALGFSISSEIIIGVLGIVGIFAVARSYLSRWMKRKRKIYSKLFERFQNMLAPGKTKEDVSPIKIPEEQPKEIKEKTRSGRQKTK